MGLFSSFVNGTLGDDLVGLSRHRMRGELGRLLDLGPSFQRGCAFVEAFDRLFARFLRRGHGPVRSASGAGRNGSEFGAEPIAEGASGQGAPIFT